MPHLLTIRPALSPNGIAQQSFWNNCWPVCSLTEDSPRSRVVGGPGNYQLATWTLMRKLALLLRHQVSRGQNCCLPDRRAFITRRLLSQRFPEAVSLTPETGAVLLRPHFKSSKTWCEVCREGTRSVQRGGRRGKRKWTLMSWVFTKSHHYEGQCR